MLRKLHIENYRVFESFDLDFRDGLNVLVGNNDSGKTTVLEAVHLALTARLRGRLIANDLSPHLVNRAAASAYIDSLRRGETAEPPEIVIDLFLEEREETVMLKGRNNSNEENACGLRLRIAFAEEFGPEYEKFIREPDEVRLVPTEYYRVRWTSFADAAITSRSVPIAVSHIDAAVIKLRSGADRYVEQIINQQLDPAQRVDLARAYRTLRESFSEDPAIEVINTSLNDTQGDITDKKLSLAVDVSQKASWESNLVPHLDNLPFQYIGSGDQTALKILLALRQGGDRPHIVLVEEPENHQSPTSLNTLIRRIAERCEGMQVLVTTHSSFVLNKLGLDRLTLLGPAGAMSLSDLPGDTLDYFKRLPGYDTLRVVLAERVILVEGPSDELIIQRAFCDRHGCMPSERGIEVITVRGLSFRRFLDIAVPLQVPVVVVTDNDGKDADVVRARYAAYAGDSVTIQVGEPTDGKTLEPQIAAVNSLELLNAEFQTTHPDKASLISYMEKNKTACALGLFESKNDVSLPAYVRDAVEQ